MSAGTPTPLPDTLGVVLAGGLARRLGGGDKGLRLVNGRPILARVIAILRPQVTRLVVNANGDPDRFSAFGLPILPDTVPDRLGPLAGILAGLDHAVACGFDWVVTAPTDAPFLPDDLIARLHAARGAAAMAIAGSGERTHPVVALWPVSMRAQICAALAGKQRKVAAVTVGAAVANWPIDPLDPFLNVNTEADLAVASRLATT